MKFSRLYTVCAIALAVTLAGCGPKDADIQTALQAKEPAGVTVSVKDGVATLSGEVADDPTKMSAEKTAKDEKGVKNVTNNVTIAAPAAPVFTAPVIAADDPLMASVKDAVKDHPTVNATVENGVITLTGSIKKDKLQKLMMTLNSLHPKKVDNKLTVN